MHEDSNSQLLTLSLPLPLSPKDAVLSWPLYSVRVRCNSMGAEVMPSHTASGHSPSPVDLHNRLCQTDGTQDVLEI